MMGKSFALLTVSAVALTSLSTAAAPAIPALDRLLEEAVQNQRVPMAVAMVADRRGVVYQHAAGAKMDAIFAIASMTKPITSVAVMQLVEAGRVKLDEPAAAYVKELGGVQVVDGGILRAPQRPVTVRHLLTHTSGFCYEFMNRQILERVAKKELPSVMAGGDAFLAAPLMFDPGTRWEYGISTDWLGRLVERVSGQSLELYFRERIFKPLRMPDTFFNVPAEKRGRLLAVHQRTADGKLVRQPPRPQESEFFSGGGGLHSTASDYMRFVRAMLAGGELDGQRILTTKTVEMMGSNQIGDMTFPRFISLIPELAVDGAVMSGAIDKFGLGFALNSKTVDTPRGVNTMTWAGIFNTFFWIDREKQVGAVLMTQMLPYLHPDVAELLDAFDRAVYAHVRTR